MKSKKLVPAIVLFTFIVALLLLNQADPTVGQDDSPVYLPAVLRQATPTFTPTPSPTPTPTATATSVPPVTGNIVVVHVHYDGAGATEPDEYVEIRSADANSVNLLNWTLRDNANHVFTFPSFVIAPGQTCRVYTNENHPEWCSFNYGNGSAIWNNSGDCAYLRNAGGALVDQYCYP